ncbi:MAG: hypothetical protein IPJ30_04570 [Acidobacteria bacterium]|nr:hypothetical protein [Acidobacteriota bacterium]
MNRTTSPRPQNVPYAFGRAKYGNVCLAVTGEVSRGTVVSDELLKLCVITPSVERVQPPLSD